MKAGWLTTLVLAVAAAPSYARGGGGHVGGHSSGSFHSYTGSSGHTPSSFSSSTHSSLSSGHSSRYCATCSRDSHGRITRSEAAKDAFRRTHPCPSTGRTSGACPGYVIDHVTALKRGGADAPSNMEWETKADAKAKDRWE